MCISTFYCYDILYVTIYVRKPRIPVNVYRAFKFLLEFEMNSSATEETPINLSNKSFQTAFFLGGGGEHIISFSLNFSLKISTLKPIF